MVQIREGGMFRWPINPLHTITGVATSVAAFVGWASEGPAGEAVLVQSWSDFESTFGGLVEGVYLGYAVSQFFQNGGSQAYIVRLVASDAGATLLPNTAAFEAALIGPAGYVALEQVKFNLLCVPGENTAAVVSELQGFCAKALAFLIVDSAQTAVAGSGGIGLSTVGPSDGTGVSLAGAGAKTLRFIFRGYWRPILCRPGRRCCFHRAGSWRA